MIWHAVAVKFMACSLRNHVSSLSCESVYTAAVCQSHGIILVTRVDDRDNFSAVVR